MMRIHKLEDGDILKILPFVTSDNMCHTILQTLSLRTSGKSIYDTKGYLQNLGRCILRKEVLKTTPPISVKFWCAVMVEGEVRFINFGRTIHDILYEDFKENKDNWFLNDKHLLIQKTQKYGFDSYDNSIMIDKEWIKPVMDINDMNEWKEWMKKNQPLYLDKFIEERGVLKNLDILNKIYDNALSDIISDIRDEKIEELIKD